MFKVEYKYSACIKIVTDDLRILCDPWFGDSANEGTWQQYPQIDDMVKVVGDFDLIYVSHIHQDHYCSQSIRKLLNHFGDRKIVIADWGNSPNHLAKKIASDALQDNLLILNELTAGDTVVRIIPNHTNSISDIDSALLVSLSKTGKSVLNVNDCIYNKDFYSKINDLKSELGVEITLFCLGYTGAGPYPQTYYSPILEKEKLIELAEKKKQQFFDRYLKAISEVESVRRLPFAGKYVLKGDLSMLNQYRGVADAIEVQGIDKNAVILDDGGDAFFDLDSLSASAVRDFKYSEVEYVPSDTEYNWRKFVGFVPNTLHLRRLLFKSIANAHPKSECSEDRFWSIYAYENPSDLIKVWSHKDPWNHFVPIATFNCNKNSDPMTIKCDPVCHSHLFIESKALFAVLTGITHWNNYKGGSVFQVRRIPDIYNTAMQRYLDFLSVI